MAKPVTEDRQIDDAIERALLYCQLKQMPGETVREAARRIIRKDDLYTVATVEKF